MKIIGIDLSGPTNIADTCVTVFNEVNGELHLMQALEGAGDRQIFDLISGFHKTERLVIGLDAPLSYNPGGGDRESDRELRRLVNEKGGGVGVMTPTMTKMAYLTLRGLAVARLLETLKVEIVEVHPGACLLLHGAPAGAEGLIERGIALRTEICEWFDAQGLKGLPTTQKLSDHFTASCAAGLAAWKWSHDKSIWCHRAEPLLHPYDFAC